MKILKILGLILVLSALAGCSKETRIVTCDGCGVEITLDADSKITDEWIVFCRTCEQSLQEDIGLDGTD